MPRGPRSTRITIEELAGLENADPSLRALEIEALTTRVISGNDDAGVILKLVELAISEDDARARESWLQYISVSANFHFMTVLRDWLNSDSWRLRKHVLQVLAWLEGGDDEINDVLLNQLKHDSAPDVRKRASALLVRRGSLGKWDPIDLLSIVDDDDWIPARKKEYIQLIESLPADHPLRR